MKLLKKQAKPVEAPASLAERIKETCAEADAYIETKVRALKASEEGRLIPIDWLDQDLRRRNGGLNCSCRVALALLRKDQTNE